MKKYSDFVLDARGNALNAATVTVVNYPSGTAATIYSDDGTTVIAGGVITTSTTGLFEFYAPPGAYDLQVRVAGALLRTITNVQIDEGLSEEVASIAALKALKGMGSLQYSVRVLSYYASATPDGGGGIFVWDSSSSATDNGGTIIAPDAGGVGRWRAIGDMSDARRWGVKVDNSTDNTTRLQAGANATSHIHLPAGTTISGKLSLPSNFRLTGDGIGISTLKARAGLNDHLIVNSDTTNGNSNIYIGDLSLDGNYTNQTTGNGIVFTKPTAVVLERVSVKNARGTGITFSGGSNNRIANSEASDNGQAAAGYGIYLYNSNQNRIENNTANNNCIGIAVEASGAGETALYNVLVGNTARLNRADFTQSGAGIHLEESASGNVGYTTITGNDLDNNAGLGLTNTAGTGDVMVGNNVRNNTKAGIAASSVVDFVVSGNTVLDNGSGDAAGYQCAIRFDDSGLVPASIALVTGNRLGGSVDGIKTFAASTVTAVGNDVRGNSANAVNFASGSSDYSANNRGHDSMRIYTGSANYDPASLADGAGATTTVTVTGAALGDFAEAAFSLDLQGITFTAWVSAANTVSVRFQNESGGVIDLASGTIYARVRKRAA